ncbi:Asp/Glu racemase [Parasalinivibrio latis]|uniref:maleate cis-trans isomerase family protein n=1 Tax=Parasalinivibrio latis TaxID=2952610 RepID=UPI0030DE695D
MKVDNILPQFELDTLYPNGKIGLIALATDINIENNLSSLLPNNIGLFTTRIQNTNPLTMENLRKMEGGFESTLATILPGSELDLVIFGCTSGTIALGEELIEKKIGEVRSDSFVTNPVKAAIAAFEHFGAKKVSILTPYTDEINQNVAEYFSSMGYEVLNIVGFGFTDDTLMTSISTNDIKEAAVLTCHPDADLLFISCTALRASVVVEVLEHQLERPVVTSNQALVWHSLSLLKSKEAPLGCGCLFSSIHSYSEPAVCP